MRRWALVGAVVAGALVAAWVVATRRAQPDDDGPGRLPWQPRTMPTVGR